MERNDAIKLANLSRMKLSDEELDALVRDMDSILGYVKEVQNASGDAQVSGDAFVENVLREDEARPFANPAALVEAAGGSQDGYVKVQRVLHYGDE